MLTKFTTPQLKLVLSFISLYLSCSSFLHSFHFLNVCSLFLIFFWNTAKKRNYMCSLNQLNEKKQVKLKGKHKSFDTAEQSMTIWFWRGRRNDLIGRGISSKIGDGIGLKVRLDFNSQQGWDNLANGWLREELVLGSVLWDFQISSTWNLVTWRLKRAISKCHVSINILLMWKHN